MCFIGKINCNACKIIFQVVTVLGFFTESFSRLVLEHIPSTYGIHCLLTGVTTNPSLLLDCFKYAEQVPIDILSMSKPA